MKTAGYIIICLGVLAFVGTLIGGHNPIGPLFWIVLGVFLLLRARRKQEEKDKLDKWNNSDQKENV